MQEALESRTLFAVPTVVQQAINPANGHTYYLLSQSTRNDAEAAANKLGGHLVKINDAAENTFVKSKFSSANNLWLGLNDVATEGKYLWADSSAASYFNWATGEPNDASVAMTEDFAVMFVEDGKWRDFGDLTVRGSNGTPVQGLVETSDPQRQNLSPGGAPANKAAFNPAISNDGGLVAFESFANNLIATDTNDTGDIFVRNRGTGTVERVSVSGGAQGNGQSSSPSMSSDGRFIAFVSSATNLVSGDTNKSDDIFVYDRTNKTTERISTVSPGSNLGFFAFQSPIISGNGQFVLFSLRSTNDEFSPNPLKIYRYDRTAKTTKLIASGDEFQTNAVGISSDGRYLLVSQPSGLVEFDAILNTSTVISPDSGSGVFAADGKTIIYVDFVRSDSSVTNVIKRRDRASGAVQNVLVLNGSVGSLSVSADGRYFVFASSSPLVANDINSSSDVYVYDQQTATLGILTKGLFGIGANGESFEAQISGNGKFVVFSSDATNLQSGDVNGSRDIFVAERALAATSLPAQSATFRIVDDAGAPDDLSADFPSTGNHVVARRISIINNTTIPYSFDGLTLSGAGEFTNYDYDIRNGGNPFDLSLSVDPGTTVYLNLSFTPTGSGRRTAAMKLNYLIDNGPGIPPTLVPKTVSLAGDAVASPLQITAGDGLAVDDFHNFGALGLKSNKTFDFKFKNTSTTKNVDLRDLNLTRFESFGGNGTVAWEFVPWFVDAPADGILKPGQTVAKRLQITTDPANLGFQGNPLQISLALNTIDIFTGQVTRTTVPMNISDSDSNGVSDYTLDCKTTTINVPSATVGSYAFANNSDQPIVVTGLKITPATPVDFTYVVKDASGAVVSNPASFTIPAGKSYKLFVTFKPTTGTATARTARLSFNLPDFSDQLGDPPMTFIVKGTAKQPVALSTVRIDAGSSVDFRDSAGTTWAKDNGFTGGSTATMTAPTGTGADAGLIKTYRKGKSFTYAKAVTNGVYKLKLFFAEPTLDKAGARKFDIKVEDAKLVSGLDVFKESGGRRKIYVRTLSNVVIKDGKLNLGFTGQTINSVQFEAILSAIELTPMA